MPDDGAVGLPARIGRTAGDWIAIAAFPPSAVVLGAGNAWLASQVTPGRLWAGLSLAPGLAGWWRLALLLPLPLIAGAAIARQFRTGFVTPGWRASIGAPLLVCAVVAGAITAGLGTAPGWLPWWAAALLLLLPCGYACAACVAMLLTPGRGVRAWARALARPLWWAAAGQGVIVAGVLIAAPAGVTGKLLGAVTILAGLRLLVPALARGGNGLIRIVDPGYSLDLVTPLLADAENDDDRAE